MFASVDNFKGYTGIHTDNDEVINACLSMAEDVIRNYLDNNDNSAVSFEALNITTLRIAALLYSETDQNIGVTSKTFGDSGTRTFVNYTKFDKYLEPLAHWKKIRI